MLVKTIFLLSMVFLAASHVLPQSPIDPIDRYIDNAEVIFVARCVASGPVNKIARSRAEIEVLHVIAGKMAEPITTIEVAGHLEPDGLYIIRIKKPGVVNPGPSIGADRIDTLPIESIDEAERIKKLSPRIAVLRTINIRIDRLESQIRTATSERDHLLRLKRSQR